MSSENVAYIRKHAPHTHKVYEMEGQKTHAHELEKRENRDLPAANNI